MKPAQMKQCLERAGVWQPTERDDGLRFQRVGLSNHIGYAGVLIERADKEVNYVCTDVGEEEPFFFTATDDELAAVIRRYEWLAKGGDSKLLTELESP